MVETLQLLNKRQLLREKLQAPFPSETSCWCGPGDTQSLAQLGDSKFSFSLPQKTLLVCTNKVQSTLPSEAPKNVSAWQRQPQHQPSQL